MIKLSRRSLLKITAAGAVSASFAVPAIIGRPALAQDIAATSSIQNLSANLIPPDMGQTSLQVYVSETGHSVSGTMLDYWRTTGSASGFGNPISEPFAAPNGLYSQAFERGIFQYNPAWLDTEDPTVRLMPIGIQTVTARRDSLRADSRRTGGDPRLTAFVAPAPNSKRADFVNQLGGRFSEVTGFSIAGDYKDWYDANEGDFYLGSPISEPHLERGRTVQYYDNGLLYETDNGVEVASLPVENPANYGFSTDKVDQGDLPEYDESLFMTADNPGGVDATQLTGHRSIVVSLSEQTMYVYQGGTTVLTSLISSGLEPNVTSPGEFHVRLKFPTQTMAGFTTETGEVSGFQDAAGDNGKPGDIPWTVADVPNVMYFSLSAEALHGAYWHNNFGNPMSHGCINQPLDVAAFMYGWAPLGTEVSVIA
ncbi:MAG: L,D-transpeptidase [Thermomicrobiales bacterium]